MPDSSSPIIDSKCRNETFLRLPDLTMADVGVNIIAHSTDAGREQNASTKLPRNRIEEGIIAARRQERLWVTQSEDLPMPSKSPHQSRLTSHRPSNAQLRQSCLRKLFNDASV